MSFSPGDVVEVPFPFVESPGRKRRPALVLSAESLCREQAVVILAMITSAKRSAWRSDVAIAEWRQAGLHGPCVVRWKVFTLEAALILSKRGFVSSGDRARLGQSLRSVLTDPWSE